MNDKQTWFAVEIDVDSKAAEAVEFALNELGAAGTEINNLGREMPATLVVVGYFEELPDEDATKNQLDEALQIYGFSPGAIHEIKRREVENLDWLAEWKKHWKPTEIEKFIVAPTWETVENADKIIIKIEPNMAFGTGTHETTKLCLRAIGEKFAPPMTFLDVGTGTGILAIGAAKVVAESGQKSGRFWAFDTDADSIAIAKENAALNDVESIEFFDGSISENTPSFDFVCANLTANVIVPLLPLLIEKTNQTLILSGILKEQEELIIAELEKFQIKKPQVETLGAWISVLVVNGKR